VTRLLELRDLTGGYDGTSVVRNLNVHVDAGEVVVLFGPNGAGKTTALLTATGLLKSLGGVVIVCGRPIDSRRPHEAARLGLAFVPEDRALFAHLTVGENLRLGARGNRARVRRAVVAFPELDSIQDRGAGLLSGGQQQLLAIARALASDPRLLVIDEMSLGLAPVIVTRLLDLVRDLADRHEIGVLLVEQHTGLALNVADRAYVLNHGDVVLEATAAELRRNRAVLEASYFGAISGSNGSSTGRGA
jgi:branched-chain amino acid transport system ATP-binding protein